MARLSFFFRRRVLSAEIRARQIAPYLGAQLNPTSGYEQDRCVCVKVMPTRLAKERGLFQSPSRLALDVVDYGQAIPWLRKHPNVDMIVSSKLALKTLSPLHENAIVYLPQQHCNFEKATRTRTRVTRVGMIGDPRTMLPFVGPIEHGLRQMGMDLKVCFHYATRHDVVEFYRGIDVQIVMREPLPDHLAMLKNPLKVANAGSFRIPTVAMREAAFDEEFSGAYLPVESVPQALEAIDTLRKQPESYELLASRACWTAGDYHISSVVEAYQAWANT